MTEEETPSGQVLDSEFVRKGQELVRRLTLPDRVVESSVPVPKPTKDGLGDWWRAYLRGETPTLVEDEPRPLRMVELFCGAGGLSLGVEQAARELGLSPRALAAVDQDAEAVTVYSKNRSVEISAACSVSTLVDYHVRGARAGARFHYPPEMIDDEWSALAGSVHALLAGPPCQGHSSLNNRTRRSDLRNQLYLTVPAVAVALQTPIVIIENVPEVVHDEEGVVDTAIALLEGNGYGITTRVLHASRMGWPQNRRRFFLVARRDRPPLDLGTVEQALADSPRSLRWALAGLGPRKRPSFMTAVPELSPENVERIGWLFDNDEYDLPNFIRPDCHKDGTTYNAVYGRLRMREPAPTITTGFFTPGRGRYIHPSERRVINAAEAARLQGFPDTYDFSPNGDSPPPRGQLAKWIGDAVPMPLGFAAGISALGPGAVTL